MWFPDENVLDVKSLIEDGVKSSGIDKDAISNIEQKYKIEIIASALPQDLYHQLDAVKGEEKEGVTDILKQKNLSEDNVLSGRKNTAGSNMYKRKRRIYDNRCTG